MSGVTLLPSLRRSFPSRTPAVVSAVSPHPRSHAPPTLSRLSTTGPRQAYRDKECFTPAEFLELMQQTGRKEITKKDVALIFRSVLPGVVCNCLRRTWGAVRVRLPATDMRCCVHVRLPATDMAGACARSVCSLYLLLKNGVATIPPLPALIQHCGYLQLLGLLAGSQPSNSTSCLPVYHTSNLHRFHRAPPSQGV